MDDGTVTNGSKGHCPNNGPGPLAEYRTLEGSEDGGIGEVGRSDSAGVRVPIVALKPCSKTRRSQGEQGGRCEMSKSRQREPPARRDHISVTVPFTAKHTGERLGIAQWAQPVVRTGACW